VGYYYATTMTLFIALIELAKILIGIGALVGGIFLARTLRKSK
jgi:hypothetical protein